MLKNRRAGDPMREESRWTDLRPGQSAAAWAAPGTPGSAPVGRHLWAEHGYGRRQAQQAAALGEPPDRDAQCRTITRLHAEYLAAPAPLLRLATTKRELLGNCYRKGQVSTTEPLRVCDPDLPSLAAGVVFLQNSQVLSPPRFRNMSARVSTDARGKEPASMVAAATGAMARTTAGARGVAPRRLLSTSARARTAARAEVAVRSP